MIEAKHYENEHGIASKWIVSAYGVCLYTLELDNFDFLDLYDDETAWLEAFKSGTNNDKRVGTIPNVFHDDEAEITFYILCAIYSACGNLKTAFETLETFFELNYDGKVKPFSYIPCLTTLI